MRILIVEDEKKVASFIRKGLQQEGYAADIVHGGAAAVQNAALFDYDLIILELMLPTQSGLDVLREIRSKRPKLPVLVLTAKGAVDDKVAALDAGADDYLIKPFAFAELSARIRALLRRATQENTRLRLADLEIYGFPASTARRPSDRSQAERIYASRVSPAQCPSSRNTDHDCRARLGHPLRHRQQRSGRLHQFTAE